MRKLKSESLTRSWLPLLSYLQTEEEEEDESVGFPGPTLALWREKEYSYERKTNKQEHKCNHFYAAPLTSNFCRSSSLPSSPSGWTGTLKYSPSSWDSNLNLNTPKLNRALSDRIQDYQQKALNYFLSTVPSALDFSVCMCVIFPVFFLRLNLSHHPSIPCFCSSDIPKDSDPMKSFLLVKSQSHTSTDRRRSLSLSLRLLAKENKWEDGQMKDILKKQRS